MTQKLDDLFWQNIYARLERRLSDAEAGGEVVFLDRQEEFYDDGGVVRASSRFQVISDKVGEGYQIVVNAELKADGRIDLQFLTEPDDARLKEFRRFRER